VPRPSRPAAHPPAASAPSATPTRVVDRGPPGCGRGEEEGPQEEEQGDGEGGTVRVPPERSPLQQEAGQGQVGRPHAAGNGRGVGAGVGEVDPLVARLPDGVRGGGRDPDPGEAGGAVLARSDGGGRRPRALDGADGAAGHGGGDGAGQQGVRGGGGEEGGGAAARARRGGRAGQGQGEQRVQLRPV